MFQLAAINIIYLLTMSILLLAIKYERKSYFIMVIANRYKDIKAFQIIMKVLSILLSLLTIFYPMNDGPFLIGDFFVVLLLLLSLILLVGKSMREKRKAINIESYNSYIKLGYIYLIVAILHFFFAQLILL